jgi:hypothetical protein
MFTTRLTTRLYYGETAVMLKGVMVVKTSSKDLVLNGKLSAPLLSVLSKDE